MGLFGGFMNRLRQIVLLLVSAALASFGGQLICAAAPAAVDLNGSYEALFKQVLDRAVMPGYSEMDRGRDAAMLKAVVEQDRFFAELPESFRNALSLLGNGILTIFWSPPQVPGALAAGQPTSAVVVAEKLKFLSILGGLYAAHRAGERLNKWPRVHNAVKNAAFAGAAVGALVWPTTIWRAVKAPFSLIGGIKNLMVHNRAVGAVAATLAAVGASIVYE
jgi:hypothetical protein